MRDSAIFYRSFYEAINEMPAENQLEVYKAVFEYALNFKTTDLTGLSKTIFTLIKPQLDANIKRFKNGKKAKQKQTRSKTGANNNVNNKDNLNSNNNLNENVNKKDHENAMSFFSFHNFWNLYNKKTGITKCENLWNELTEANKALIMQKLPLYIKATEADIIFRKDPATWLEGKHWLDEHVPSSNRPQNRSALEIFAETGRFE